MNKIFLILFLIINLFLGNSCTISSVQSPCGAAFMPRNIYKLDQKNLLDLKNTLEKELKCKKNTGCPSALLAYIYSLEGKLDLSEEHVAKAIKELPQLEVYLRFISAKNKVTQNDYKQAKSIAQAILDSKSVQTPSLFLRTKYLLADIAMREKDYWKSTILYKDLLQKGYEQKEVLLYNLAFSLESIGKAQEADEVYKRLLIEFPSSGLANDVKKLKDISHFHFSLKEQEKRFDKLIAELKFDQAISDLNLALQKNTYDDQEKDELSRLKTKAFIFENKFKDGVGLAHKLTQKNANAENLSNYAFTLAKVGRQIAASENYLKAVNGAKTKEAKAKACFFAGFSLYESSLYSMAQLAWSSCEDKIYETSYSEDFLWYQALASIMMGHFEHSQEKLKALIGRFNKSVDKEKYLFFLAHSLEKSHKKDLANHIYKELSGQKSPSYYSMLSRKKVGALPIRAQKIPAKAFLMLAQNSKEEKENAVLLYNLGFAKEAKELIERSKMTKQEKLAFLQSLGRYHYVAQRSYQVNPSVTIDNNKLKTTANIRSSFPMLHEKIVKKASQKHALSKSFIYAVMKAESVFSTSAKSNRGALGLMQIMPNVAHNLAGKLDIAEFKSHLLHEPKININFGSLMLAMLKKQFLHPHLYLAAYNAGPHNVQKWINTFGDLSFELFVERIPFKQTRDYVKKVLVNESLYFALDGNELRLLI